MTTIINIGALIFIVTLVNCADIDVNNFGSNPLHRPKRFFLRRFLSPFRGHRSRDVKYGDQPDDGDVQNGSKGDELKGGDESIKVGSSGAGGRWDGQNWFQSHRPDMMKTHGYMDKDGWLSQTVVGKEIKKLKWTPIEHIQKVLYIRQPVEIIKMPVIKEEKTFIVKNKAPTISKSKIFAGHSGHGYESDDKNGLEANNGERKGVIPN